MEKKYTDRGFIISMILVFFYTSLLFFVIGDYLISYQCIVKNNIENITYSYEIPYPSLIKENKNYNNSLWKNESYKCEYLGVCKNDTLQ